MVKAANATNNRLFTGERKNSISQNESRSKGPASVDGLLFDSIWKRLCGEWVECVYFRKMWVKWLLAIFKMCLSVFIFWLILVWPIFSRIYPFQRFALRHTENNLNALMNLLPSWLSLLAEINIWFIFVLYYFLSAFSTFAGLICICFCYLYCILGNWVLFTTIEFDKIRWKTQNKHELKLADSCVFLSMVLYIKFRLFFFFLFFYHIFMIWLYLQSGCFDDKSTTYSFGEIWRKNYFK